MFTRRAVVQTVFIYFLLVFHHCPSIIRKKSIPPKEQKTLFSFIKPRTGIIFLYKIIHHLVAIYPTNLLTQSDPRTRQYPHSYSYRLIQTSKDSYKYSFFPRTIAQWNLLPVAAVQCTTLDSFREQIPISILEQHCNI